MKVTPSSLAFALGGALVLLSGTPEPAPASTLHVCMDFPISRVGAECTARSPQKVGACPVEERSANVNVFRPGETITVRLRETINHPSHYRIAFNPDGDTFQDPARIDDVDNTREHVLVDGIVDVEEAVQEVQITLPGVTCENCTLQLIQVMHDKQGNGFGGANGGPNDNDDIYYSCADIALRGDPIPASAAQVPVEERRSRVPAFAALGLIGLLGISIGGVRRVRNP